MQKIHRFLPSLLLLAALGCSDSTDESTDNEQVVPGPGAFDPTYKTSSSFFSLMSVPVAGDTPHKAVKIWYSANAQETIDGDRYPVAVGTVAIKEGYNEEDEIAAITVMVKQEAGFDPDNGDWFYEMRSPTGEVMTSEDGNLMEGKLAGCIGCHSGSADTDYLNGTGLR